MPDRRKGEEPATTLSRDQSNGFGCFAQFSDMFGQVSARLWKINFCVVLVANLDQESFRADSKTLFPLNMG